MPSAPFRKILIATDFSPSAERALERGAELAQELRAQVLVVHAYDLPIPLVHPAAVTLPDPFIQECRRRAAALLEQACRRVGERGVAVDSRLSEVPAAAAINATAEEWGADLIVMGTRGHRGLKRLLLGSVAARTLHGAPCSVLTVPLHED